MNKRYMVWVYATLLFITMPYLLINTFGFSTPLMLAITILISIGYIPLLRFENRFIEDGTIDTSNGCLRFFKVMGISLTLIIVFLVIIANI